MDKLPVASDSDTLVRSDRRRRLRCIRTSAPASTTAGRSAFRTPPSPATSTRCACASSTRTSRTSGPYPIPSTGSDRGRPRLERRPPRDHRRHDPLQALRAVRALPAVGRPRLDGRVGRDLEPALEQAAPRHLDLGRRGRPADPAGPGPLRRGEDAARSTTRCASRSRRRATRSSIPRGTTPRRLDRPEPAGDGPALPPEDELRHLALPAPGADRAPGAQDATA